MRSVLGKERPYLPARNSPRATNAIGLQDAIANEPPNVPFAELQHSSDLAYRKKGVISGRLC